MPTINDLITRLFPHGTNPLFPGEGIDPYPPWPPDLFAIAASLVERSGCYSHPRYTGGGWCSSLYDDTFLPRIRQVARDWNALAVAGTEVSTPEAGTHPESEQSGPELASQAESPLDELARRWQGLAKCQEGLCHSRADEQPPDWCDDAMWLLAAADEASAGIGFFAPSAATEPEVLNHFVEYWARHYTIWDISNSLNDLISMGPLSKERIDALKQFIIDTFTGDDEKEFLALVEQPELLNAAFKTMVETGLPHLPSSLCRMVPPMEVCVQPKTRTSEVGCTLRSLSHHLALLPSLGQVETHWRVASRFSAGSANHEAPHALNLLLVPFPYAISGNCFKWGQPCLGTHAGDWDDEGTNRSRFFRIEQEWLREANGTDKQITSEMMTEFLVQLIEVAKREVQQVHGLILPELALSFDLAQDVADKLRKETDLELFISGILANAHPSRGPRNSVFSWVMKESYREDGTKERVGSSDWEQAKHHRWKVEKFQISKYHIGGRLDPHVDWWEHIDISPRQCYFGVFRHEACLTALVCEDLARVDPVQTAIRSIGPNLVVALLMDGPQTESRWSGRYATVLADDPGCAVITLTSMGLLRRSALPAAAPPLCQIALWKEAGGDRAVELSIPPDHHALLLTLSHRTSGNFTIEGRPDVTKTVTLSRSGTYPIKHPKCPDWITI